jgi:hypothetical protein
MVTYPIATMAGSELAQPGSFSQTTFGGFQVKPLKKNDLYKRERFAPSSSIKRVFLPASLLRL